MHFALSFTGPVARMFRPFAWKSFAPRGESTVQ
jgi:hypothetical protein